MLELAEFLVSVFWVSMYCIVVTFLFYVFFMYYLILLLLLLLICRITHIITYKITTTITHKISITIRNSYRVQSDSLKTKGGPGRNEDVLIELYIHKMAAQHETYPLIQVMM